MRRRMALLSAVAALVVLAAGCASKGDFNKLSKRVDAIQAEQETQSAEMTKLGGSVRTVESSTAESVADVDKSIATVETALKKLQDDLAEASNEIASVVEKHKDLDARFGNVSKSVTEAQKMLVSTLKNARDIYGAQYRALNEVLEGLETPTTKPSPQD